MPLYLGNSGKLKVILDGVSYYLNMSFELPPDNKIRLLSSDGYVLQDVNGVYLQTNEG
jgi:hypothetical protein